MLEDRPYMREPSYAPRRSATVTLLIVNVAAFVLQMAFSFYVFRADPASSHNPIIRFLALSVPGVLKGYVWQFLTFQLLHGGWIHLLVNCLVIYMFGREVEDVLGRKRFLLLYFGAGVLGGVLQVASGLLLGGRFAAPVVGASAGAFGLVAAFACLDPNRMLTVLAFMVVPVTMRAKNLLLIAGIATVLGIAFPMDNVAHVAHLGGLLAGMIYVNRLMDWAPRLSPGTWMGAKRSGRENSRWAEPQDTVADDYLSKEVDPILDKISAQGIQSLTEKERQILERARQRMGRR